MYRAVCGTSVLCTTRGRLPALAQTNEAALPQRAYIGSRIPTAGVSTVAVDGAAEIIKVY